MIVKQVEEFVMEEMEGLCSAHDFAHIDRVRKISLKLAKLEEKWDLIVIELWALLHESLDDKFFWDDDLNKKVLNIELFLNNLNLNNEQIENILFIIKNVWYWKSLERSFNFKWTIEFEIVEDADRLEAVGAIAIARVFAYWGKKWRPIHDPSIQPSKNLNRDSYTKSENTSINHFYEKLLLLKDMMHTWSWSKIAQDRHVFMKSYLSHFFQERDCEL